MMIPKNCPLKLASVAVPQVQPLAQVLINSGFPVVYFNLASDLRKNKESGLQ